MVSALVWLLKHSIRWQYIGSSVRPEKTPCVVCYWHGRLLLSPFLLGGWRGPVIISDHKDGELIAGVYRNFGVAASRGSSSKGGARALLKVIRMAKEGYSPGITPDGPRGPQQVAKAGAAHIALKTGLPILPVCFATNRFKRLKSWDNFYLPYPFAKGVVVVGEPLWAKEGESVEDLNKRIQQAMDDNQQQADDACK
ncbi:MAG: lysophospholipid acyltransferase family protein [Mariprofundaceae bacterium]|nr:lysophospholipid acyltransferase family protein [Mariprofundaceae bacterium]